ncbi:ArpU family phage packaging/lysis transcriptional regulator [Leuconostoc falkenbergense]|uniref:ArpU family phage packaging/lysis transcriptional regulator n=1 Tax=Leuconostoc falkenbergense TaxID=2766470 RepID=UPI0024A85131|nr:ArpU family phage packaging/lysis transcriptional regulator [Leuconostoc falkenbergense]MDI6552357.1 ArpU family phage packaging/lysis transcriptional regulator [Leuconostoc falkenbergense]
MLLPEIDEKATINNVRRFFEHEVDRIARVAQEDLSGLKSPMMSDMPKSASNGNHVDERLTKQIQARVMLDQIKFALSCINYPYRQILEARYVDGMSWLDLGNRFKYSPRQLMRKRDLAFLYFADTFETVHDFHIYDE